MVAEKPLADTSEDDASRPSEKPVAEVNMEAQRPEPQPAKASDRTATSIIGEDVKLVGNIDTAGDVHVTGEVEGTVRCGTLIVGEPGQINGGVVAENVDVHGRVNGHIHSLRVVLHKSSQVEAEVHHRTLVIEQGAHFVGKSRRSEDPLAKQG